MTKEFFESNTFEDVIERLNDERDEITTLDRLKEFAKAKIDDGNYFVAKHILEALQSGYEEYWRWYDYCMGTLDTPIPMTEKADVEHLIDDQKGRLISMYKRKTKDCYAIEGNCGYGWDIECNCKDYKDAKEQLKTYRENVNYPVRIKKWRERIGE